jgi:dihydroorotate dehydrogenase
MADPYPSIAALLRLLPPSAAHGLALGALKRGLVPAPPAFHDPVLACRIWNLTFANPIGLAAGFDKDGEAVDALLGLGFGFVEAGTVTPEPQPGNPRPNLFRLGPDRALINRLGFPSRGLAHFAARLETRAASPTPGIVGANISRNRDSIDGADAAADFARCAGALGNLADYLVINVSSPNTPGLRQLQDADQLARLIGRVRAALDRLSSGRHPPLLIKIAPDADRLQEIVEMSLVEGIEGLIMGNTTVARPDTLRSPLKGEAGGLSGPALRSRATAALAEIHTIAQGRLVLIGCGGVASGTDAYAMIRAGASLVQLYTVFVYDGPGVVNRIKRELARHLEADGFATVGDAVGADLR